MITAEELRQEFRALYGDDARVFRAPGRINLIGEHTDYNDGFVMPAAIDLYALVACGPRPDRRLLIGSENFAEAVEFDLDEAQPRPRGHWSDYARGVALALEESGRHLRGANLLIRSGVPVGAGLSSSAAIEVAVALALLGVANLGIDRAELARLCQRAENEFVGARVGIMDQFVCLHGRAGHALLLDCRSLDYRLTPLPENARLVIANTMVKHELATNEYNTRRAECEAGVRHLQKYLPGIRALRDVSLDELERHGRDLPEAVRKRCRHVISENARVMLAAEALERGDLARVGQLMLESHDSLRDDYEVSCWQLDVMVRLAMQAEGAYGARMTGGGFGGSVISIVEAERAAEFGRTLAYDYEQVAGLRPEIYTCAAAEGAKEMVDGEL
ncbi:MAG TPA: galactokinase [Blastocatellia bacterium]|nr:galactokinase [Blastocatellia bacterium]